MKEYIMKNKKKVTIIAIAALVVIAAVIITITVSGDNSKPVDAEAISSEIDEQLESEDLGLTEEEKEEVKDLESAMNDELAAASTEEEKQAIVEKYSDKISDATGGKVEVTKPSGSSGGNSSGNSSGNNTSGGSGNIDTGNGSSSGSTSPGTGSSGGSSPETSTEAGSSGGNSGGNSGSGSDSGSSSGSGDTPHKHTVTVGDLGWADSADEIRQLYYDARDQWKTKVAAGDTTTPEPLNYTYKICSCGKYTGYLTYGSPHSHIAVGNTGKWFNTKNEAEQYYNAESKKWGDLWENFEITDEEYANNAPSRYEIKQCSCGKYTLSWWTRADD